MISSKDGIIVDIQFYGYFFLSSVPITSREEDESAGFVGLVLLCQHLADLLFTVLLDATRLQYVTMTLTGDVRDHSIVFH